MSLISHQRDGELGHWMAAAMTGTAQVSAIVRVTAAERTGRVLLPAQQVVDPGHWAAVDAAFRLRLAFMIQPAPPYSALYGAAMAGLTDDEGANAAAATFPTHRTLDAVERRRSCDLRPTRDGWFDVGPPPRRVDPERPGAHPHIHAGIVVPMCSYLAERLSDDSRAATRTGTDLSHGRSWEAAFARACWAMGSWHQAYRTGDSGLAESAGTTEELLAAAPDAVVEDIVELVAHTRRTGALDTVRALSGPASDDVSATVEPTFVPHWAEGDLVIGGTLICVQSPVVLRAAEQVGDWLRRLLAQAWLDTTDRYRIRRVGLYLARQARLITWSLDTFAAALLQTTVDRVDHIRRQFLTQAARAAATEGIDTRWFRIRNDG